MCVGWLWALIYACWRRLVGVVCCSIAIKVNTALPCVSKAQSSVYHMECLIRCWGRCWQRHWSMGCVCPRLCAVMPCICDLCVVRDQWVAHRHAYVCACIQLRQACALAQKQSWFALLAVSVNAGLGCVAAGLCPVVMCMHRLQHTLHMGSLRRLANSTELSAGLMRLCCSGDGAALINMIFLHAVLLVVVPFVFCLRLTNVVQSLRWVCCGLHLGMAWVCGSALPHIRGCERL